MNRIFRLAADKIFRSSADIASAEPVLRGTVYDRGYNELAVSYPLYSVIVRPGEVTNREEVIRVLHETTGMEPARIAALIGREKSQVVIADSLEKEDVAELRREMIPGVYVRPVQERFYPGHESSAMLVGYTSDGIGLAGIEGAFDMLLQHGEFKAASFPEIDFAGREVLGRSVVDIALTMDMSLQKEVEKHLQAYLDQTAPSRGEAVLLDARTGAVLAWAALPSFNPNYYWRSRAVPSGLDSAGVDAALIHTLQVKAAAVRKNGEAGPPLLPETVAAPDYGLGDSDTEWFRELAGPHTSGGYFGGGPGSQAGKGREEQEGGTLDMLQLARIAAGLVNGGWQVRPHVLASVFDHDLEKEFERSADFDAAMHRRFVSPTMGIRLKRELFAPLKTGEDTLLYHSASSVRMVRQDRKSSYVMQELLLGAIPAQSPSMILVVVTRRDALYPAGTRSGVDADERLAAMAKAVLPPLLHRGGGQQLASRPAQKNPSNYNRFLISRRMELAESGTDQVAMDLVMPELSGLSLRKGLQRLNAYPLMVRIEGSGHIVSQSPSPGERLQGVGECILKLDSKI